MLAQWPKNMGQPQTRGIPKMHSKNDIFRKTNNYMRQLNDAL